MASRTKTSVVETEMVDLETLGVDDAYQRTLKMNLVQLIANDWNDEACGIIVVSEREGKLYVVDGQHRVVAAKLLDKKELPARVVRDHTQEKEAELRLLTNTKRNERAGERFKAKLAANKPEALALLRLCRDFDCILRMDPSEPAGGSITALATVERIWAKDRGVQLRELFRVIHTAYGRVDGANTRSRVLLGILWFLDQHTGEFDRDRLVKIVLRGNLEELWKESDRLQNMMGGGKWINFYRAMVERYNTGLPKAARLEMKTRGYRSATQIKESD